MSSTVPTVTTCDIHFVCFLRHHESFRARFTHPSTTNTEVPESLHSLCGGRNVSLSEKEKKKRKICRKITRFTSPPPSHYFHPPLVRELKAWGSLLGRFLTTGKQCINTPIHTKKTNMCARPRGTIKWQKTHQHSVAALRFSPESRVRVASPPETPPPAPLPTPLAEKGRPSPATFLRQV